MEFLSNIGTGWLITGGVAVILAIIPLFLKDVRTVGWGFGWMKPLVKIWKNYDIPQVSGEAEAKLKNAVSGTFANILLGMWLAWSLKGVYPKERIGALLNDLRAVIAEHRP